MTGVATTTDNKPLGWACAHLGQLGSYINGRGFKKSEWKKSGRPIIRIQDLTGSRNDPNFYEGNVEERHLVRPGDLLVSWAATLGAHIWQGPEGCLNQHIFKVESFIEVQFHYYLLTNCIRHLERETHGSGMVHVTRGKFDGLPVPVPPLAEQHRIVEAIEAHFSRLDAAVAALKRVQANLKRYRASVLKAACEGRLVPTEAELARKEGRDYEPASKLLERILTERRKRWEGRGNYKEPIAVAVAPLCDLPKGWVWATFDQLSRRVTVGHVGPMKERYVDSGIPFLRGQNVRPGRYDPDGLKYINEEFHRELTKSVLTPGDVVVTRSGNVGVACVVPEFLGEANCSDLVIIQRPIGILPSYASMFMNGAAQGAVRAGQVGVALTHFNTKSVALLAVALPPMAEQQRIVAEVERRLSVVDELEAAVAANLKRAERLRQAILKRAFEGRLVPTEHELAQAEGRSYETAEQLLARIKAAADTQPKSASELKKRNPRRKSAKAKGAT